MDGTPEQPAHPGITQRWHRPLNPYLGRRWRGQGTHLKSWGMLYTKLMIWGMKNMSSVSEKWPRMPATARVMPEKYVNVSPTKT